MSRGRPGTLITLEDGRKGILYVDQPLLKEKGKIVIHLLNDDLSPAVGDDSRAKTLIKDVVTFDIACSQRKIRAFGKVD